VLLECTVGLTDVIKSLPHAFYVRTVDKLLSFNSGRGGLIGYPVNKGNKTRAA
jgi:hypothetical protein